MFNILIVEDDKALNAGISMALKGGEMIFDSVFDLAGASQAISEKKYDLIILDVNLPDGSGLDFLEKIRRTSKIPVMMLTANDLETDIVTGLALGADDYVTKPFSLAVLRARVDVQLRKIRDHSEGKKAEIFTTDQYYFDFEKMEYFYKKQRIELSRTDQRLLRILVENRGCTVTREKLLEWVWPDGIEFVEENALSVAIKRLRDKLSAAEQIKTVYGIGYSWVVK